RRVREDRYPFGTTVLSTPPRFGSLDLETVVDDLFTGDASSDFTRRPGESFQLDESLRRARRLRSGRVGDLPRDFLRTDRAIDHPAAGDEAERDPFQLRFRHG